ncbi:MAG: hypothetical protein R2742_03865 [Micropruina glycogenica]
MTVTLDSNSTEAGTEGGVGRVARVIGPVVDVEFPADQMPDIYNASADRHRHRCRRHRRGFAHHLRRGGTAHR